ncbi:MAG: penicillin-binding protein activator [Thiotrichales bacterium]|nr:penicillin-binding protein activator [Thiotrichales bacterium]
MFFSDCETVSNAPNVSRLRWQHAGLSALLCSLLLAGCFTPKPSAPPSEPTKPVEPSVQIQPVERPTLIVASDPQAERVAALQNRDWARYVQFSDELWQTSAPEQQAKIEQEIWQTLLPLDALTLMQLDQNPDPRVNAWTHLLQTLQTDALNFPRALEDLQQLETSALYQNHLLPQLLSQRPTPAPLEQIAILLPMQGKFKVVAEQIQTGLLKAYYDSGLQSNLSLRFYDSSDESQISSLYFQAKQNGAQRIIGPLRKPALEQLVAFDDENLIALNSLDYPTRFVQFNLKSSDKTSQLINGFVQQNIQTLGLLNSDEPGQRAAAEQLSQAWQALLQHALVQVTYSDDNPQLRQAFDRLLNIPQSLERRAQLRNILGIMPEFYPYSRQDLQAIVVFDSASRLAVINPQKSLYLLSTPLYAATDFDPQNAQHLRNNRDLKEVQLLTQPMILNPNQVNGIFEAFGWDAMQAALNLDLLRKGACLTHTQTGQIRLENNRLQQHLVWAKFDAKGQLRPYQLPSAPTNNDSNPAEEEGEPAQGVKPFFREEADLQQRLQEEMPLR